jgi:heterodisulfide reductase subunit B
MIDKCKKEVEKALGRDIRIPVLNISQIVGLSLGMSGESLGVDAHKIVVDFI